MPTWKLAERMIEPRVVSNVLKVSLHALRNANDAQLRNACFVPEQTVSGNLSNYAQESA